MTSDNIPTWAIDEALQRSRLNPDAVNRAYLVRSKGDGGWQAVYQLALMIAKHEAPPAAVDADLALARNIAARCRLEDTDEGVATILHTFIKQVRAQPIEVTDAMVEAAYSVRNGGCSMKATITAALTARGK